MATRKIFKHNFVPEVPLTEEYINGKRYYVLPDGQKFRSVTTVLNEKFPKTGLMEWRKRVGEAEANKIMVQSSRRGTAVHKVCEKYVLNEDDYAAGVMPSHLCAFRDIQKLLDEHVDNVLGVELPLYSVALRTAGRCDLIADYNGIASIIDYKTSKKEKKEEWIENYFIQATCYSMMFEWMYKIAIPQIVLMIAVDDDIKAQLFVKDRKQYIDRVIELFTSD